MGSNPTSTATDLGAHRSWQPIGGRVVLPGLIWWSQLQTACGPIAGLGRSCYAWSPTPRTALNTSTHAAGACLRPPLVRSDPASIRHRASLRPPLVRNLALHEPRLRRSAARRTAQNQNVAQLGFHGGCVASAEHVTGQAGTRRSASEIRRAGRRTSAACQVLKERDDARDPAVHGAARARGVGQNPDDDQDDDDPTYDLRYQVICLLPANGHLTRTTRLRITTRWVTQNERRNREAVPRGVPFHRESPDLPIAVSAFHDQR